MYHLWKVMEHCIIYVLLSHWSLNIGMQYAFYKLTQYYHTWLLLLAIIQRKTLYYICPVSKPFFFWCELFIKINNDNVLGIALVLIFLFSGESWDGSHWSAIQDQRWTQQLPRQDTLEHQYVWRKYTAHSAVHLWTQALWEDLNKCNVNITVFSYVAASQSTTTLSVVWLYPRCWWTLTHIIMIQNLIHY